MIINRPKKIHQEIEQLLLAFIKIDNIIVDPFSGSGTTVVVAEQLQRL